MGRQEWCAKVTGILVFENDKDSTKDGIKPDKSQMRCSKEYGLEQGCIWKSVGAFTETEVQGYRHEVAQVTLGDGTNVLVDWGLDQFQTPESSRFFA
jgi:hypothetical protein